MMRATLARVVLLTAWSGAALALTSVAWAQQPEPLTRGWSIMRKVDQMPDPNAVACSRSHAFARSWHGDVAVFDGRSWTKLPRLPGWNEGKTYGKTIAATPSGQVYVAASGGVARWNGQAWSRLEMPGWTGDIGAMTVLGTGQLVVVGDGRIGLRSGSVIASHDAGTWRALRAVGGTSFGDLWTAGQGGTVMRYDGRSWARMATGSAAWLRGLVVAGPGTAWAWDDSGPPGQAPAVLRFDGHAWVAAAQGIDDSVRGMAGDARHPWAIGESSIWRFDESSWVKQLGPPELGAGHHGFVGICSTETFVFVGDYFGNALIHTGKPAAP